MNNACPACNQVYSLTAQHIGLKMSCQKCKTPLVVGPEGLRIVEVSATPKNASSAMPLELPPSQLSEAATSTIMDFLAFRSMITPTLLKIFFWIGCVGIVLMGVGMMILPLFSGQVTSIVAGLVLGPIMTILLLIQLRVTTEIMLVVFKFFSTYETLTEIKNELARMNR